MLWHLGSTAARARFPAPIGAETLAVPTNQGLGTNDGDRLCHTWTKAEEPGEKEAVAVSQAHALRSPPLQDLDLMAKGEIPGAPAVFAYGPELSDATARSQTRE